MLAGGKATPAPRCHGRFPTRADGLRDALSVLASPERSLSKTVRTAAEYGRQPFTGDSADTGATDGVTAPGCPRERYETTERPSRVGVWRRCHRWAESQTSRTQRGNTERRYRYRFFFDWDRGQTVHLCRSPLPPFPEALSDTDCSSATFSTAPNASRSHLYNLTTPMDIHGTGQ